MTNNTMMFARFKDNFSHVPRKCHS